MTLLEQLERGVSRVRTQLQLLTREQTVLTEQITRLRTGARPEIVWAELQVALGDRLDLYLVGHGDGPDVPSTPADRLPAARRKAPGPVLDGHVRLRTPNTAA